MSHNVWKLEFYRDDQAKDYNHAYNTGALRTYPVDPPDNRDDPLMSGAIGNLLDVILLATDMMEHEAKILFFLTEDSLIVARFPESTAVGLRTPWKWVQPKNHHELVQRLNEAADLAVPERERENLCKVAADFLYKLRPPMK